MFKHHAKKNPTLYMTKLASLKKIHKKIIIMKRNLELNDPEFLLFNKSMP